MQYICNLYIAFNIELWYNRDKQRRAAIMTAKEALNLIDWLRKQGFDNDKIVECLESVEGRTRITFAEESKEQE